MVETQEETDDIQDYGPMDDDDGDLPAYLTSDYLDQCMLYQSSGGESVNGGGTRDGDGDGGESQNRSTSAMSNYSRPMSR